MTACISHPPASLPIQLALFGEAEAAAVPDQAASGTLPPSLGRPVSGGFGRSPQGPMGGPEQGRSYMTQTPREQCQPRYHAYCIANDALTKEEMWERDGSGINFMLWVQRQWTAWEKETGQNGKVHTDEDHANFNAWLFEHVNGTKGPDVAQEER